MLRKFGDSRGYNADYYFDMRNFASMKSRGRYHHRDRSPASLRAGSREQRSVVAFGLVSRLDQRRAKSGQRFRFANYTYSIKVLPAASPRP